MFSNSSLAIRIHHRIDTKSQSKATVRFISFRVICLFPITIYDLFIQFFFLFRCFNFLPNFLLFCLNAAFGLFCMRNIESHSLYELCNAKPFQTNGMREKRPRIEWRNIRRPRLFSIFFVPLEFINVQLWIQVNLFFVLCRAYRVSNIRIFDKHLDRYIQVLSVGFFYQLPLILQRIFFSSSCASDFAAVNCD